MKQVWLRTNRRVWLAAAIAPALCDAAGALLVVDPFAWNGGMPQIVAGIVLLALGGIGLALVALLAIQPRVAYHAGQVAFALRLGPPTQIPVEFVECFLLGHGPALLPGEHHSKTETRTVVVRLAERAEHLARGDAHPLLAAWCDGYITIRGTWCEPLSVALVDRLNRQLHEANQARLASAAAAASHV